MRLSRPQTRLISAPLDRKIFLDGITGTGKTTVGTRRLRHLLDKGVPAEQILVLVPQKALALPYVDELKRQRKAGGQVDIMTIGSLSLHMVELFWPLVANAPGFQFAQPQEKPHFLSLEVAQYYMHKIIGPLIDRSGYFASVRIERSRLFSQLIDNLNKAAVVGINYQQVGERLKAAWRGDVKQVYVYNDAQECMNAFRQFCLDHNLLDFSLQVTLFIDFLWEQRAPRRYLLNRYRHLIVDNIEEDNPATQTMLETWLPECQSALVIYDSDAGYRRFLGSDEINAQRLIPLCNDYETFDRSFVMSEEVAAFGTALAPNLKPALPETPTKVDPRTAVELGGQRYHPQMIDWTADEIARLVQDAGVPPSEIVVIAPFLSDSLRFALMNRLEARNIPARSHRPSRALREEPAALALLTLTQLAHPPWHTRSADNPPYLLPPTAYDVALAFTAAIAGLDLVRARLLVDIVYRKGTLTSFDAIQNADVQQRITFDLGARYEALRGWLQTYQETGAVAELDFFLSRLFGEVLSREGFGFHNDFDAARTAANLIDSARNFRQVVSIIDPTADTAREYVEMVKSGILADAYPEWRDEDAQAVLLAPAYTFLMSNRPVDYQFWLNAGSPGWGTRIYQPLTHPYVLSLQWQPERIWTDEDDFRTNQEALYRLTVGLIRRCRQRIYLGYSELGEQGYEQRGDLLNAIQRMLRRLAQGDDSAA